MPSLILATIISLLFITNLDEAYDTDNTDELVIYFDSPNVIHTNTTLLSLKEKTSIVLYDQFICQSTATIFLSEYNF